MVRNGCVYIWLVAGLVSGCSAPAPETKEEIAERCRVEAADCSADCVHGDFRYCYVDPAYSSGAIEPLKECHGVHVGRTCRPCEQRYALNFGGSMRNVSCEEFYESLGRKNAQCGNCLQRVEHAG